MHLIRYLYIPIIHLSLFLYIYIYILFGYNNTYIYTWWPLLGVLGREGRRVLASQTTDERLHCFSRFALQARASMHFDKNIPWDHCKLTLLSSVMWLDGQRASATKSSSGYVWSLPLVFYDDAGPSPEFGIVSSCKPCAQAANGHNRPAADTLPTNWARPMPHGQYGCTGARTIIYRLSLGIPESQKTPLAC